MGIAAVSLGSQLNITTHEMQVHRSIGIAVIAIVCFQAVAAFAWRPQPAAKSRYQLNIMLPCACMQSCAASVIRAVCNQSQMVSVLNFAVMYVAAHELIE